MHHYDLLFSHSFSLEDPLQIGDAFRYQDQIWQVTEAMPNDRDGRMLLRPWPTEVPYPDTIWGESPK